MRRRPRISLFLVSFATIFVLSAVAPQAHIVTTESSVLACEKAPPRKATLPPPRQNPAPADLRELTLQLLDWIAGATAYEVAEVRADPTRDFLLPDRRDDLV